GHHSATGSTPEMARRGYEIDEQARKDKEKRQTYYSQSGRGGTGILSFVARMGFMILKSIFIRPIATVLSAVAVAAFWAPVYYGLPFVLEGDVLSIARFLWSALAVVWAFAAAEYCEEAEGRIFYPGLKGPSAFGFVRLQLGYILTIGLVVAASELLLPYLFRWFPAISERVPAEAIQAGLVMVAIGYRYLFHPVLRYFDWRGNIRPDPEWGQKA
ncbi:hypothetical protein P7L87_26995, partial [Vibrio parahaemolyticus]|nr:hypothetical protein [Vibrio parahaemolyticus]